MLGVATGSVPEAARADEEPARPEASPGPGSPSLENGDLAAALEHDDQLVAVGMALPRCLAREAGRRPIVAPVERPEPAQLSSGGDP